MNATDVQTGCAMASVLPAKGSIEKYAVAELRRFMFGISRTFGIIQYDVIAKDLCKTIGGLSMRAAPTGHSQSQGSVGNVQRTLYGQLGTLFAQVQESTGLKPARLPIVEGGRVNTMDHCACLVRGLTQNCLSAIE